MIQRADFPLHPPGSWFDELPDWFEPGMKVAFATTGPDAGRVAATVAPRDQCVLDGRGGCWTAPFSPTRYAAAHQGDTLTAEGNVIATSNIGGGVNHAREALDFRGAVRHYENTASQVMRVRYHDLDGHIVALGALWPDVTDQQLAVVRASGLSGDWRWRPEMGAYDMCGSQLVSNPAFPLMVRKLARVAALGEPFGGDEDAPVYVGGVGGPGDADDDTAQDLHDALDELLAVGETPAVTAALAHIATKPGGPMDVPDL